MSATLEKPPVRLPWRQIAVKDHRCSCGKLLFRGHLAPGSIIAAWCRDCKREVIIQPS